MQPEDYLPQLRNPNLRHVSVGLGSARKDRRFEALLRAHGLEPPGPVSPFEFS